jgi:hypothetical protein
VAVDLEDVVRRAGDVDEADAVTQAVLHGKDAERGGNCSFT